MRDGIEGASGAGDAWSGLCTGVGLDNRCRMSNYDVRRDEAAAAAAGATLPACARAARTPIYVN